MKINLIQTMNKFPRMLNIENIYLITFGIFGVAPFSVRQNLKNSSKNREEIVEKSTTTINYSLIGCCYNVSLVLIVFGMSFIFLPVYYEQHIYLSPLSQRIELVLAVAGIVTVITVWICYCLKQSEMVSALNDLIKFDTTMNQQCEMYNIKNNYYFLHSLFFLYIILSISTLIVNCLSYGINIAIIDSINSIIIGLHVLQYSLCLGVIKKRFESINRAMINIYNNHSEYQLRILVQPTKFNNKTIFDNIVTLRRGHRLLANICSRISNFYGTPILFSITYFSGIIVYYMYLVIVPFVDEKIKNEFTTDTLEVLLLLVESILVTIAITVYGNAVVDEMALVVDGINKLINVRLASREVNWELEQFALEMLHRKINFEACGIFFIDCSLLRSIASMTMTYLILLVQSIGN